MKAFSCFRTSVHARLPAQRGVEKGCVHVGEQTGAALTNANVDLPKKPCKNKVRNLHCCQENRRIGLTPAARVSASKESTFPSAASE